MKLNSKQIAFAQEFVKNNHNATQAAIAAGYSEKAAFVQGSRLLRNDKVASYIAQLREKAEKRTMVDFDWCLKQLKKVVEVSFSGEASKEGVVAVAPVVSAVSEINKMLGHHAPQKIYAATLTSEVEVTELKGLLELYEKDM